MTLSRIRTGATLRPQRSREVLEGLAPAVLVRAHGLLVPQSAVREADRGDPVDLVELCARLQALVRFKRYTDEVDSAESVICGGAESLDDYRSAWPTITSCPEKVAAGVHLDLDDQTAGVWTTSIWAAWQQCPLLRPVTASR